MFYFLPLLQTGQITKKCVKIYMLRHLVKLVTEIDFKRLLFGKYRRYRLMKKLLVENIEIVGRVAIPNNNQFMYHIYYE